MRCKHRGRNSVHFPISRSTFLTLRELHRDSSRSVTYEPSLIRPGEFVEFPRSDIGISDPITGKYILLDFTFPIIKECATIDSPSVAFDADAKHSYYKAHFDIPADYTVIPAAIDSFGRHCSELKDFIRKTSQTDVSFDNYSQTVHRLRVSISVMHVKAIARQQISFLKEYVQCIGLSTSYFQEF